MISGDNIVSFVKNATLGRILSFHTLVVNGHNDIYPLFLQFFVRRKFVPDVIMTPGHIITIWLTVFK